MEMSSFIKKKKASTGFPPRSGCDAVRGITSSSSFTQLFFTLRDCEHLQAALASNIQLDTGCSVQQW